MNKKNWVNLAIIATVILIAYIIINLPTPTASKTEAQCIGINSILYTQIGCHACETQKEMFGGNYQYLNAIDCTNEPEKCSEISKTPTWVIEEEQYLGVQSLEELKKLTGC
mgnify:CR=1 FL=1